MRISSMHIFNIANKSMADANQAIAKTQEQISSGKRILTAADDPVAATKIMQLTDEMQTLDQYNKNIDIAQNNLVLEESVLSNVNSLVVRIQELAVQAGNTGTLTNNEYKALAQEVDARMEELKNLMNTRNANGDYIFGGFKSKQAPFSGDAGSGFSYHGDEGQQFIKVANDTTVAATDSGKKIFMDIVSTQKTFTTFASSANTAVPPAAISVGRVVDQQAYDAFYPEDIVITFNDDTSVTPPGTNFTAIERSTGRVITTENGDANHRYTPGDPMELKGTSFHIAGRPNPGDRFMIESSEKQDALTTLARFSEAMKSHDNSAQGKERLGQIIAVTLDNLKNIQTSVSEVVSNVGARFNILESMQTLHKDSELVTKEALSDLRDLDYAEASTRLSMQAMVLQAAQQSFIRISQLTLFNKL
jgi:flagellar hook-associated protein 3 FlgL